MEENEKNLWMERGSFGSVVSQKVSGMRWYYRIWPGGYLQILYRESEPDPGAGLYEMRKTGNGARGILLRLQQKKAFISMRDRSV